VVETRFAVAQLVDEGDYLVSSVGADDDTVAGLIDDMKEVSATFDRMKQSVRRKLVDLKQTFENNVVEVSKEVISKYKRHKRARWSAKGDSEAILGSHLLASAASVFY